MPADLSGTDRSFAIHEILIFSFGLVEVSAADNQELLGSLSALWRCVLDYKLPRNCNGQRDSFSDTQARVTPLDTSIAAFRGATEFLPSLVPA